MNSMVRRSIQNPFKRAESLNVLRVDPKLIDKIKAVYDQEHPGRKPEQHNRCVEYPIKEAGKPALANGDAQVVLFTGMMNNMEIPKQSRFVAHTMKNVVCEIIDQKQDDPGPPGVSRKLVRGQLVTKEVDVTCNESP